VVAGGKSSAATRLALLFRGLDRAYGIYEIPDGKKKGKVQGKAETVRGEITPDLWDLHLRGRQGLGIVPVTDEGTCFFGAIDVDQYDLDMAKVEQQCALLGLPMLPTRTKSGGIHLYTFAAEAVSADLMRSKLEEWSVALGYGGAEIFPKQSKLASVKDVGNWINMPYFGALEGDTERYGIFKGKKLTLDQFVARAEAIRVTEQLLEDLALPDNEDFEVRVPGGDAEQWPVRGRGLPQEALPRRLGQAPRSLQQAISEATPDQSGDQHPDQDPIEEGLQLHL
jgi:hypothetical protein